MKVFQRESRFRTSGGLQVRDITDEVNEAVRESGITHGIAVGLMLPHVIRFNSPAALEGYAELGGDGAHQGWARCGGRA